jgi:[CysO sulfur-carrier protein]-S-L-cysteine hydrolase
MTRQDSPAAAPIVIPTEIAEQMRHLAVASYPAECCGLLFAPPDADAVTTFVPMTNLQDRLHAMDPESYPRTSRNGFQMHALHAQREVDAAVARGERLLAFVHSHIDCDAYFSQEDIRMAAPPPEGTPLFPDVSHVVIACWSDGVREACAFQWDGRSFAARAVTGFAAPRHETTP